MVGARRAGRGGALLLPPYLKKRILFSYMRMKVDQKKKMLGADK